MIVITSFGYGHAPAPLADITLDVRHSLRNPHHDPVMRTMTGLDAPVREHVTATPGARDIVEQLAKVAESLAGIAPSVRVAIGCVGGRHRSVALAEELGEDLAILRDLAVYVEHRDITRDLLPSRQHA